MNSYTNDPAKNNNMPVNPIPIYFGISLVLPECTIPPEINAVPTNKDRYER